MTWIAERRVVAEPTGTTVTATAAPGAVLIHFDVAFRTVEWPWEEKGPVSLIPQASKVSIRANKGLVEVGFALPDAGQVVVPASHSSTARIKFTLPLSNEATSAVESTRDQNDLQFVLTLVAHPFWVFHQQGYANGIDVRPAAVEHTVRVAGADWEKMLQQVGFGEELDRLRERENLANALISRLQDSARRSDEALETLRDVLAEQAVSKQSVHFHQESELHATQAAKWLNWTKGLTLGLALFAVCTLVLHKIPWVQPTSSGEDVQFAIGKTFVFATIAYFLALSSRSYRSHLHNAIVNKHRQNSLAAYRALVEAAGDAANRDIVLTKAADSIFGAQGTGFTKHDGEDGKALSMVNVGANAFKTGGG